MPIQSVTMIPAPGYLVHRCAACGAQQTISFDRGAQRTRRGPFALRAGDTVTMVVDGGPPVLTTFAAGAFPDFRRVGAGELASAIASAVPGLRAREDHGGVLLESETIGDKSDVQVIDGTARVALGLGPGAHLDPGAGRPVLGCRLGELVDVNVMVLRRCSDCGANECLVRTFDAAGEHLDGTHLKEHRKAVNTIAEHCKSQGWSHPAVAARHAEETARPRDIHDVLRDHLVVVPPGPVHESAPDGSSGSR
jgi:hypothetical protein